MNKPKAATRLGVRRDAHRSNLGIVMSVCGLSGLLGACAIAPSARTEPNGRWAMPGATDEFEQRWQHDQDIRAGTTR